jgi:diguanylate cyclase (GGDEF)-like protein
MVAAPPISTRLRVALLLAIVLLLFVGLNMAALGGLVFPAFASFEREDALRNIGRVAQAIRREQRFLADFSRDWAHWDDMYVFVEAPTTAFIDSTLTAEATTTTPSDVIALFGIDGEPRHLGVYRALERQQAAVLALLDRDGLLYREIVTPLLDPAADGDAERAVLFALDGELVLAVGHAVLHSDLRGPSRGVFLMATLYDEARLAALGEQTLVAFELRHRPAGSLRTAAAADTFSTPDGDRVAIDTSDPDRLRLSLQLPSADRGSFELSTDYRRQMTREGGFALLLALGISTLSFVVLVAGLFHRLLLRSFLRPLKAIEHELNRIEEDRDLSARLPLQGAAELQRLAVSFNAMMVEVEAHRDEIALLSMTDALTRLPNRRQFEQVMEREWQRARRQREPLAVLFADVDFFKAYNDHYGHQLGDDCLRRVGQAMYQALKRRTDFVARYGGEEFVLVLPATDPRGALTAAERMLLAIRRLKLPHARSPVAPWVTMSIGVFAAVPDEDSRSDDWLACADTALYAAKAAGRNRALRAERNAVRD